MFLLPNSRYKCRRAPVATIVLVTSSSLLWFVVWMLSYPQQLFAAYGFVAARPNRVSVISAIVLHQGIIFVLPNMIFLSVLGKQLEDAISRLLFLVVFFLSGVAGTALFYVLDRTCTIPCTGSAGAVAGIVAAFWLVFPNSIFDVEVHLGWWHVTTFAAKTFAVVGAWLGWQIVVLLIHVPLPATFILWSNVGGFVAGIALAMLLKPNLETQSGNHPSAPGPEQKSVTTLGV
jgi:membrane associated rhomboid family serine protease